MTGSNNGRARVIEVTTVGLTLTLFAGLPKAMLDRGLEPEVVSAPDAEFTRFCDSEGVPGHGVPMARRIGVAGDLCALARLALIFRRRRPAIVDAHTPKGGLLGVAAARLTGVPVVIYHVHGLPFSTARGARRLLLIASEWFTCALADWVIYVSESARAAALNAGLCPVQKSCVLRFGSICGVDTETVFNPDMDYNSKGNTRARMGISDDALVIGYLGRFACDKGLTSLFQIWQTLRTEFADLHLLLVGELDERDPPPTQVMDALSSDPRVHIYGWTHEPQAYFSAMDVFAFPSLREGFGLVAAEAGAMRIPTVAYSVTGCVDVIDDGATGRLVPAGDDGAFTDALRHYLEDLPLRTRHGDAARERIRERFGRVEVTSALVSEYERLFGIAKRERSMPTEPARRGTRLMMRRRSHDEGSRDL